ncbi:MAG: YciI family protein [Pseudomonadota bacterium]
MQYMMMIFEDEAIMNRAVGEAGFEAYMAPWVQYTEDLEKAGVMRGGNPLGQAHTASTVSVRDGKRMVQDGPFADTKEQLGGYYLIEVDDLDQALAWAEKCPAAVTGHVEVRPIADLG